MRFCVSSRWLMMIHHGLMVMIGVQERDAKGEVSEGATGHPGAQDPARRLVHSLVYGVANGLGHLESTKLEGSHVSDLVIIVNQRKQVSRVE